MAGHLRQRGLDSLLNNPFSLATVTVNNASNITVTPDAASTAVSYGIYANSPGLGTVSVTNSGNIDPGTFGMHVTGGGDVPVTNTAGDVTGNTGIFASNTYLRSRS